MSKKQADYWCKIVKEYRKPIPLDAIKKRLEIWAKANRKSLTLDIEKSQFKER